MEKTAELENIRHSLSHLLAHAVLDKYPDAKFGIGPVIETGFYYDFLLTSPLAETDLRALEDRMRALIKEDLPFKFEKWPKAKAKKFFKDQPFKLELIDEIEDKEVGIVSVSEFTDLCRGGHVKKSGDIPENAFMLDKLAGAYWKGSEKNQMLQRVYGLAFADKAELEAAVKTRAEAEKRDHRKLGAQLDLFTFSDLVGPGLPLWTPKGTLLRNLLDDFVWELRAKHGYEKVEIPHITKKDLFVTSGHWDKFKDELFRMTTREGHEFALKPMNCPFHTQIYARKGWSYRELPQRYANTTMCYRDEQTGELSGLTRTRSFTQDDAHVFCRRSQVKAEFLKIWDIIHAFYGAFGFKLEVRLSTHDPKHPDKYLGDKALWDDAENTLKEIVSENGADWVDGTGEAAFYGPKLDFMAKDSLGRKWQVATIQIDMNMPERFDLSCTAEDGKKERIVMIHAAIMGSIGRFMAILIEHFGGDFPLWLSPVQVAVLAIGEGQAEYAKKIKGTLAAKGIRAEVDARNESIGKKIRDWQAKKPPFMAIVGGKEAAAGTVSIRSREKGDIGAASLENFAADIQRQIRERK